MARKQSVSLVRGRPSGRRPPSITLRIASVRSPFNFPVPVVLVLIPLIFSSTRVLQLLVRNRRVFSPVLNFFSVHGFYFLAVANGRDFCALVVSKVRRILPFHRGQRARIMCSHLGQLMRIMRSRCRQRKTRRITPSRHGQLQSKRIAPSCLGKRTRSQPSLAITWPPPRTTRFFSPPRRTRAECTSLEFCYRAILATPQ